MRTITEWRQWLGNEVGDAVPESSREITIATLAGMATAYGNHYAWKLKNVDLHDVETTVGGPLVNPATFRSSRNYSLAGKIDKVTCVVRTAARVKEVVELGATRVRLVPDIMDVPRVCLLVGRLPPLERGQDHIRVLPIGVASTFEFDPDRTIVHHRKEVNAI